MRAHSRIAAALRGWFRPAALDSQVAEELRFHLDRQIEANLEAGMTPDQARRAAHLTLGNPDSVRQQSQAAQPGALVHQGVRDLLFGIRLLRRAPGFTALSALVVALGIGSTTTIFSVVYGVMLRPLPYPEPDRLVGLWSRTPTAVQRVRVNPADQRELRRSTTMFEDIALASAPQNFNLIGSGEPERLFAARLSADLFEVLRVSPALGRSFLAQDEQSGRTRVVLLSDGLWRRRYGADPSVVGRMINLSGEQYEVVGVMRPDFQFPGREYQLWIPLTINPAVLTRTIADYGHFAVARLRPDVDIDDAQREVDLLAARLEAEYPATNRSVRLEVLPLLEESVRAVRPALYVMLGAVCCLLLVACLNLAGLFGARAVSRTREFAVRQALGASRARLALQALAEVAPVFASGGVLGVAGAKAALAAFVPNAPAALPRVDTVDVSGTVLAVSAAILLLTGLATGLLPAVHAWRVTVPTTTGGSRSATAGRGHVRMRSLLIVAQLALTLPLLAGATALARSFAAVITVEPGFRTEQVLSLHMAIPRAKYRSDEQIAALYHRLLDRVATIPGVRSAAMINRLPLAGNDLTVAIEFEGVAEKPLTVPLRSATPDYFTTMSIPLREGRALTERDSVNAPLVSVIDERLARTLWPGQSAVGKRFRVSLPGLKPAGGEVVGVVGTIRHRGLDGDDDRQVYFSYHQFTDGRIALVVRAQGEAAALAPAVREAIRVTDPEQPVYDLRTMEDVLARSAAERWLTMAIIAVFAAASLVLAGAGLYGVMAHTVAQRVREFGVRLALGAVPSGIARLVLRDCSLLAGCGAALGVAGAIVLLRGLRGLLYGVSPVDPSSLAAAAGVLLAVTLAAGYVPARRAAQSDPARALRGE